MAKANSKKNNAKHRSSADFLIAAGGDIPFNYVEAVKSLRTNLNFISATEKINTLVLTSAIPGEGKTDAAILGRYADGAILCVRSNFAPKETVQLAKERLTAVGVRILGVVLTGFDAKNDAKSSAYSYAYEYEYKSKPPQKTDK